MAEVVRVLAPNPGPFTLDGTNTWVVGRGPALVIDPGPDDAAHLDEILREATRIGAILLTHHHPDHAPGAAPLARRCGAPVLAFRPASGEGRLRDGQEIRGGGVRLRAVHAPGHSSDHAVFHDPDSAALFTGDTVLGRGTSIVDPPEGNLAAYLRSLGAMLALAPRVIYPGHGPTVWDAAAKLREYLEHRELREGQVLAGLQDGPRTPEELVPNIYAAYPPELHPAAARSVLAHLLKLEDEGRVARVGRRGDNRFTPSTPAACARCGRPAATGSALCARCSLAALQEGPARPDPSSV